MVAPLDCYSGGLGSIPCPPPYSLGKSEQIVLNHISFIIMKHATSSPLSLVAIQKQEIDYEYTSREVLSIASSPGNP